MRKHLSSIGWIPLIASAMLLSLGAPALAQNEPPGTSNRIRIERVAPNPYLPSNGSVEIAVAVSKPSEIEVAIFGSDGKLVASLLRERRDAGTHTVQWDGRNAEGSLVAAGVYICRLVVGKDVRASTLVVAH
jgi:hypothetical protein